MPNRFRWALIIGAAFFFIAAAVAVGTTPPAAPPTQSAPAHQAVAPTPGQQPGFDSGVPCVSPVRTPFFYRLLSGRASKNAIGTPLDKVVGDDYVTYRSPDSELYTRLCGESNRGGDWSLLAILNGFVDGDPTYAWTDWSYEEWVASVSDFLSRIQPYNDQHMVRIVDEEAQWVYTVYETVDRGMPVVHATHKYEPPSTYMYMRVSKKNGSGDVVLKLRVECGGQVVVYKIINLPPDLRADVQ